MDSGEPFRPRPYTWDSSVEQAVLLTDKYPQLELDPYLYLESSLHFSQGSLDLFSSPCCLPTPTLNVLGPIKLLPAQAWPAFPLLVSAS